MKSVFSWFINIASVAFWVLRLVALLGNSMQWNLPIGVLEPSIEIPLLFITVISLVFVFKMKLFGAITYFVMYLIYFGVSIVNTISTSNFSLKTGGLDICISVIGILIAFCSLLDILLHTNRTTTKSTKKTDWFFKDEKFDREMDERADKNNYRIF